MGIEEESLIREMTSQWSHQFQKEKVFGCFVVEEEKLGVVDTCHGYLPWSQIEKLSGRIVRRNEHSLMVAEMMTIFLNGLRKSKNKGSLLMCFFMRPLREVPSMNEKDTYHRQGWDPEGTGFVHYHHFPQDRSLHVPFLMADPPAFMAHLYQNKMRENDLAESFPILRVRIETGFEEKMEVLKIFFKDWTRTFRADPFSVFLLESCRNLLGSWSVEVEKKKNIWVMETRERIFKNPEPYSLEFLLALFMIQTRAPIPVKKRLLAVILNRISCPSSDVQKHREKTVGILPLILDDLGENMEKETLVKIQRILLLQFDKICYKLEHGVEIKGIADLFWFCWSFIQVISLMELKPYYHSYFGRIVNDVEKCRIENTGGDLMTEILIMGCVRMRNKMIEMMPALGMFCPIFPCQENEKEMQTKLSQKMVDRVLVKDRHMVGIQGLSAQDTTLAFFIFSLV